MESEIVHMSVRRGLDCPRQRGHGNAKALLWVADVILYWTLPGVPGLEIWRRIRARESRRTLPVIVVTALGEDAERMRGGAGVSNGTNRKTAAPTVAIPNDRLTSISRPLRANTGRSPMARGTRHIDPKHAFKVGPMNER
jgi:DNA-binding NarL/FixJ family response regulator